MKYKGVVLFFVFFCGMELFPQEDIIDMLLSGEKRHVELYYNDELGDNIYNLVYTAQINKIEDGFYELEIDNTCFKDYYIFKVTDIKNNEKTITGQLTEIWHGNAEGDPYCDEYGNETVFENGTIEIDIKDNAVTMEFVFFMFGSKYTNKIVLKEVLTG